MLGLKKKDPDVAVAETTDDMLARKRAELKGSATEVLQLEAEIDRQVRIIGDKQIQIPMDDSQPWYVRYRLEQQLPGLRNKLHDTRAYREQLAEDIRQLEVKRAKELEPQMLSEIRSAWAELAPAIHQVREADAKVRAAIVKWQEAGVLGRAPHHTIIPSWSGEESVDVALRCAKRDGWIA
jgi:hypothetical protein